jgi:hypothetical protein
MPRQGCGRGKTGKKEDEKLRSWEGAGNSEFGKKKVNVRG